MKKHILGITLLFSLISSCSLFTQNDKITNLKDYEQYLQPGKEKVQLKKIDSEIAFWQKRFSSSSDDIVARTKIASLFTQRFSYSGNIHEIHQADSIYQLVNHLNRKNSSGTFRSLAANCITQHKFLQAQLYIDSALNLGDDKYQTVLMEFDVALELGNKIRATKALNTLTDINDFSYLIRESKYKDHVEGDLNEAILIMEQAWEKIKDGNNNSIKLWTKSNLGDLYGHANRYKESYQCYLEVLAKDPEYYHALKGIAWLAFSKDKNINEAKHIIHYLRQQHPVPDYDLLLSEIASYENKPMEKLNWEQQFIKKISNVMYGDMYNKYLFNLQANELNDPKAALTLAQKETGNRRTGEAFSWLAWAYLKNGQKEKALKTAQYYVEEKCFEPDAVYYLGKIYLANGDNKKAKKYLEEAYESSYELGPSAKNEIKEVLKQL